MRILIFSFFLNRANPSGLATSKIIIELANRGHEIYVITSSIPDIDFSENVRIRVCSPSPLSPARVWMKLGNIIGVELNYIFWEWRSKRISSELIKVFKPHILYGRGSPIASLTVPAYLKKKFKIPFVAHFADPIPAPKEWVGSELERKKLIKSILPVIENANYLGFVTKEMQEYQGYNSKISITNKSFLSPNSIISIQQYLPNLIRDEKIILFMGSFLGLRTPESLLKGFELFSSKFPKYTLHFYGADHSFVNKFMPSESLRKRVKLFPFNKEPYLIMAMADILIDVDAFVEKQVFLSSKFMDYLTVNRFLMAISTSDSPSSQLIKQMPESTVSSTHDPLEIAASLEYLAKKQWKSELFNERQLVLKKYFITDVVDVLELKFKSLT